MRLANLSVWEKLARGEHVNVIALGSSNTQRIQGGMHWFDILEFGTYCKYGAKNATFINAGVAGETSRQLLERLERDVIRLNPDLVIITVGGNDSAPSRDISQKEFVSNLDEIVTRIKGAGSEVIMQTYYACDLENMDEQHAKNILVYMQLIRDAAKRHSTALNDNYTRWEKLRQHNVELYRLLMNDHLHVKPLGNSVIGLDLLKSCDIPLPDPNFLSEGQMVCELLNLLN